MHCYYSIVKNDDISSDCYCLVDLLVPISRGFQVSGLLASRFCKLQITHLACPLLMPYLPPSALEVHTPLRVDKWSVALTSHPNQAWTGALIEGLRTGVRIGHNPARLCKRARTNCRSAHDHPEVVDKYLANELALGRVAGPFPDNLPGIMISEFGVIPKSGQPRPM